MCIHDQCDTILVSVDQRIIMPPLTSLSVPNKPFSQNTNIASITAHTSLENFPKPVPPAQPSHQAARPSQARRRGVASGEQAGRARVECVHCSGDREPLTRPAAPIRHGQALRRERRGGEGTNPGHGDRRPRPRENQEDPSAAPLPGWSIPAKAHCQFTHDKPFRVRSCPY